MFNDDESCSETLFLNIDEPEHERIRTFRRNPTRAESLAAWDTQKGSLAMTSISKALLGAAMGAGALAFSVVSAPAAVVCTGFVCWHTHEVYEYPPDARVVVHPDDWRWGSGERFTWREHEGRGYWRGERWMDR
jgi:hypothetical protein